MTRLLVWRHGQTRWNATDRVQGHTDIDLDEVGRAQAEAAAAVLAAERPDLLIASDLRRAYDTAGALAARTGLAISTDPRLRERCYGDWEGLTGAELRERYPEQYRLWRAGQPVDVNGVEDTADLAKRVGAALADAAALADGGTVVVATHGGSSKRGIGALCGWSDATLHALGSLHNCHWSELRERVSRPDAPGGWRLIAHNVGIRS